MRSFEPISIGVRAAFVAFVLAMVLTHPGRANSYEPVHSSDEGRQAVGMICVAFAVLVAEFGSLERYSGDVGQIVWADLDFDNADFNGRYFRSADYYIVAIDKAAGTYTVGVGPSTVEGGPTGTYTRDESDNVTDTLSGVVVTDPPGCCRRYP